MESIRLIKPQEADFIFQIYRDCAKYHAEQGFFQWDEHYPTLQIIENDIRLQQLSGLFSNDLCLGIISLNHDEPIEYKELEWEDKSSNYIIIHRLCIDVNYMQKGYAKQLMSFSENWAKNKGFSSIRLDTYTPNKGAVRFYNKLNYLVKGEVYFEKKKKYGYTCFEKIL